jgi:hypothetical protein
MKVITPAHLESWKQSRPALIEVTFEPADLVRSNRGDAGRRLVPIRCKFENPVPRGEPIRECYLLDQGEWGAPIHRAAWTQVARLWNSGPSTSSQPVAVMVQARVGLPQDVDG